jgi:DNA-binding IclR family transcriptional regulator
MTGTVEHPPHESGDPHLVRAVRLLRAVAAGPATTGALAAATGLPPATASRLLAAWRDLGFVDQDGPRSRWNLGPQPCALALNSRYARIARNLEPALNQFARRHGCGVALSLRRGLQRINIIRVQPASLHSELLVEQDDLVRAASGRLFLALAPPAQRRRLCAACGLPGPAWPQAVDTRELMELLRAIAAERRCEVELPEWWAIACALPAPWGETLAMGAYLPRTQRDLRQGIRTALKKLLPHLTRLMPA